MEKVDHGFVIAGKTELGLLVDGKPVYVWAIPDHKLERGDKVLLTFEVPVHVDLRYS